MALMRQTRMSYRVFVTLNVSSMSLEVKTRQSDVYISKVTIGKLFATFYTTAKLLVTGDGPP